MSNLAKLKKGFYWFEFFKFQNPISLGVYQIWNQFVNWFTSEASLKLMARGLPLHLTNLLKPIWVVMESSVLKIWSTKSSLLATISNMFLTCCGPSNWTLPMVDGARKPTILLKVVILVAVKTKSMLFSVTWFRNIPTFLKVKFSTIFWSMELTSSAQVVTRNRIVPSCNGKAFEWLST